MNYIALIDYFKRGIVTDNETDKIDFKRLNQKAVKYGYIVKPECCNKYVDSWLNSLTLNYNATFYKTWIDIIYRDRFELYLDQLLHYASTYGQNHEIEGNGYVPNDGSEAPNFKDLKVIEPITEEELVNKCFDILKSGIALKTSTMIVLSDCYLEIMKFNKSSNNYALSNILSEIKNKEAVCYISNRMDVLPNDEFGMLRCIVYRYTNKMLLIQDKVTLSIIKNAPRAFSTFKSPLLYLNDHQIEKLSRIFLRYKALFLAMKSKNNSKVNHVINRLRKLAVKNHTPLKAGFWENIITTEHPAKEVKEQLENIDNFRKIRLMMICKHHLYTNFTVGMFTIRNGKQFIRTDYYPKYNVNWISKLYSILMDSLCKSLRKKKCTIRLPKFYDIALPTSEKNFIGNFPYGTCFDMDKDNVIGIYWKNEWGTRDFDLSMVDILGQRIAWNSDYYSGDTKKCNVIYSGDMTNADPEATELIYMRKNAPDGIFMVNKYSSYYDRHTSNSKLRFFYATENIEKLSENYMVDPNNIKFDTMLEFEAKEVQKTIGFTFDNRFYLMDMVTGRSRVSNKTAKYADTIIEAYKNKAKSFIYLKEILLKSGFEILDNESEVKPDIDFTNLEKDTLINLLQK